MHSGCTCTTYLELALPAGGVELLEQEVGHLGVLTNVRQVSGSRTRALSPLPGLALQGAGSLSLGLRTPEQRRAAHPAWVM